MSSQTLFFDTSVLPTDVLSFYDDTFYQMVEKIAGRGEAKLLEVQGIRGVYSFLNTADVFEILSIPCAALKDIKKLVCLEADDKTYTVKLGCRSSIRYLYQLLHQKHEEHVKTITIKSKRNKQAQSQQNSATDIDLSQASVQDGSTSLGRQQYATTSDSMNKLNHHDCIIHMLNEWFEKNRHAMNIPNGKLIENEDFKLLFVFNGSSEEVCISCSCGIKVRLTKDRQNFSLSNYYKHIKSKSCIMMKKKKMNNTNVNDASKIIEDHESFDDEISPNISIADHTQSSASTITTDTTVNTGTSFKRSSTLQNKILSKRQCTQK